MLVYFIFRIKIGQKKFGCGALHNGTFTEGLLKGREGLASLAERGGRHGDLIAKTTVFFRFRLRRPLRGGTENVIIGTAPLLE